MIEKRGTEKVLVPSFTGEYSDPNGLAGFTKVFEEELPPGHKDRIIADKPINRTIHWID